MLKGTRSGKESTKKRGNSRKERLEIYLSHIFLPRAITKSLSVLKTASAHHPGSVDHGGHSPIPPFAFEFED